MATPSTATSRATATRRQVLRGAGATAVAGLGTATFSGPTAAQASQYDVPSDYTQSFDREFLERYQPLLVTSSPEVRSNLMGMWGYKVTSPDSDYAVAAYWAKYATQAGLSIPLTDIVIGADAHAGDHEPVYLYVDEVTGEVDRVVATGYHHFAMEVSGENAHLTKDRDPDRETHVSLDVVDPWHHYQLVEGDRGFFPDLYDWTAARDNWVRDGIYDTTALYAVDNPYVMLERDSWWDRDTTDYQFAKLWLALGLRGADSRDELRRE